MIPVYGHRYMNELPASAGTPVFSIVQSDIIGYGRDLAEYLRKEFRGAFFDMQLVIRCSLTATPEIPFWGEIYTANDQLL